MSPDAERIECSVASSAGGTEGPPAGAFRMAHDGRLIAVADAIGIHAQTTGAAHRALQSFFEPLRTFPESAEALRSAIQVAFSSANAVIATGEETHGIATAPDAVALTALGFLGTEVVIAHVGNVRCYRARAGSIAQLTRDHSAVAELRGGSSSDIAGPTFDPFHIHHRNLLTRALGMTSSITTEVATRSARRGDRFLLCTASVWSDLSEAQLHVALDQARSPEDACRLLRSHMGTRIGYVIVAADVGDRSETTKGVEG